MVTIPFLSDKASCALGIYGTRKFQKLALRHISHISFATLWEPLFDINSMFHFIYILFCRCLLLKDKKVEGILLTCLLIPTAHINTLAYLMQVKI
jgi:hypothetical protein